MNRYIIKKTILASSLEQAILKEKRTKPAEIFLDDSQPEKTSNRAEAIGFNYEPEETENE